MIALDSGFPALVNRREMTVVRVEFNMFVKPSAVPAGMNDHILHAGILVLPDDEVVSYPVLTQIPDPNIPNDDYLGWQSFGRLYSTVGFASGDPYVWRLRNRLKRRLREDDRLVAVTHYFGTENVTLGFVGRVLVRLP